MGYNLAGVWASALADTKSANLDTRHHQARLRSGVKIIKDKYNGEIRLYNALGDYYVELSWSHYHLFITEGWVRGCYRVSLDNYRSKLDRIEVNIRRESNSKGNRSKKIKSLKESRAIIMNRYRVVSQKLKNGKH